MDPDHSNDLCLECGLCCNGVIFADVRLQPGDDPERLRAIGLALTEKSKIKNQKPKFAQPCAALDGCRCRIYPDRPTYCRQFECLLLKSVKAGRMETAVALRTIRSARRRAEKVKRLLRELGDDEEHVALSVRFRRMKKRVERGAPDSNTAGLFGELTLAMHDLNVVLSTEFYMECAGRA